MRLVPQRCGDVVRTGDSSHAPSHEMMPTRFIRAGEPARVFGGFTGRPSATLDARQPERPAAMVAMPAVTIVDLGDFDAATYAERLDAWCPASLVAWGARLPVTR